MYLGVNTMLDSSLRSGFLNTYDLELITGGIGASNATPDLLGRQRPPRGYWGVKGPNSLTASKIRGVRGPYMGRGRKGHYASEFRESKFRRQGSRRQRSRASKEMNPFVRMLRFRAASLKIGCCF